MAVSLLCRKGGEYIIGLPGTSRLHQPFYTPKRRLTRTPYGAMHAGTAYPTVSKARSSHPVCFHSWITVTSHSATTFAPTRQYRCTNTLAALLPLLTIHKRWFIHGRTENILRSLVLGQCLINANNGAWLQRAIHPFAMPGPAHGSGT